AFLLFDVRAHDRVVRRQVERVARRKRLLQSLVELVFLTLHVTCRSSRRNRRASPSCTRSTVVPWTRGRLARSTTMRTPPLSKTLSSSRTLPTGSRR